MKKSWLILIAVSILLVIGVGAFFLMLQTPPGQTGVTPGTTLPQSGTGATDHSLTVSTMDGNSARLKDFINNGQTIADSENTGSYLLAGELGYCLPDKPCTAGTEKNFNIFYDSSTQIFTIALLTEPLGVVRDQAEQYLLTTLGITHDTLCTLKYYVGTTYQVNETYASGNLGFKNCPGATKLP